MIMAPMLHQVSDCKLSVFLFHKVPGTSDPMEPNELTLAGFEAVLDFIGEHYTVIPLAEASEKIARKQLKGRLAAITFDDGYPSWATHVAQALLKRQAHATFFVTTGQLHGAPIWNERLSRVIRGYKGTFIDGRPLNLPDLPTSTDGWQIRTLTRLDRHLKYLPPKVRESQLQHLESLIPENYAPSPTIAPRDIQWLAGQGFGIGGHTVSHPILSMCDRADAREEMAQCKAHLEEMCRIPVKGFAYPNGRPDVDFSRLHVQWAQEIGYQYAVTSHPALATTDTSVFQIPRFTPWGPSANRMALQMIRRAFSPARHVIQPSV